MAKSVTYSIDILTGDQNKTRIDGLRASVVSLQQDLISIGSGMGDRIGAEVAQAEAAMNRMRTGSASVSVAVTPDYSKQLEALDRFKQQSDAKFDEAGGSARKKFEESIGGLADDLRGQGEQAGKKFGDAYKQGLSDSLSQLTGISGEDLETLLNADNNDAFRLGAETGDKYREGLKSRLADDLGIGGDQAAELFGAQGGAGLAQQQEEFRSAQQASMESIGANLDKLDELDAKGKETSRALSGNFREIASKAEESASGLAQLASGIAFLFADSKDAKKLVDTLLAIKGTADVVLGTFKTFSGALQIFSLFGDRSELQAKQQKEQAQATRLTGEATAEYVRWLDRENIALEKVTNGNMEHARALREVAEAAERAANEERQLNNAQGQSDGGVGGRLSGRVGGRTPRAGRGKAGMIGGVLSMFGSAGVNAASNAVGDSSGIIDNVGDAGLDMLTSGRGGAGRMLKFGKAAGAIGSAAALGKLGYDVAAGGGMIDPNSGSGKVLGAVGGNAIGGSVDRFLGLDTPAARLAKSFEDLDKAVKRHEKVQEKNTQAEVTAQLNQVSRQGDQQLQDFRSAGQSRIMNLSVQNGDMSATGAASAEQVANAKQLREQLQVIKDYENGINLDKLAYIDALNRANTLYEKQASIQEQMIAAVRSEAEERKRLNAESISAAEQRIGLIEREKGLFQTNEEKLAQAAQRFSRLSDEDKQATIEAQRVASSGGRLDKQQRRLLEGVGLGAEQEVVKRQDIADAQRAGFFNNFGSFEKQQMQGSMGRADQLASLQQQAEMAGQSGSVKEREAKLRELNRAQEGIGRQQQAAGQARAGGPTASDRRFDAQTQAVRVELDNRKEVNVQIQVDTQQVINKLIQELVPVVNAQGSTIAKAVKDGVEQRVAQLKAAADANAAAQRKEAMQRRNSG